MRFDRMKATPPNQQTIATRLCIHWGGEGLRTTERSPIPSPLFATLMGDGWDEGKALGAEDEKQTNFQR